MSAILVAIIITIIAIAAGVASSEVFSRFSYSLFGAQRTGEKVIINWLGGIVGLACGLGAIQTGNTFAAFWGPVVSVAWLCLVFVVLAAVGKFVVSLFR